MTVSANNHLAQHPVYTNLIWLCKDVNAFPGHIACDGDSNSEIVVPIIHQDKVSNDGSRYVIDDSQFA